MTRYKGDFPTATAERKALVARYYLLTDKYHSYCKLTNTTPADEAWTEDEFITLEGTVARYETLCKEYGLII